jgi:hypothetical protein
MLRLIVGLCLAAAVFAEKDDYIKVDVRGTIATGVVAIGGETTGVTITANKTTLELSIKDPKLKKLAEELNGKKGIATGTLQFKTGTEIKKRYIVEVTDLKAG